MKILLRTYAGLTILIFIFGCATPEKVQETAKPLTRPLSETTEEIFKVRSIENKEGKTKAVISPADQKQVKIPF